MSLICLHLTSLCELVLYIYMVFDILVYQMQVYNFRCVNASVKSCNLISFCVKQVKCKIQRIQLHGLCKLDQILLVYANSIRLISIGIHKAKFLVFMLIHVDEDIWVPLNVGSFNARRQEFLFPSKTSSGIFHLVMRLKPPSLKTFAHLL